MAAFVFNISHGRVVEFHTRVKNADPVGCGLYVIILAASGLETNTILLDKDTMTDVVAGTTNEVTNVGYARKAIAAASLTAPVPEDIGDTGQGGQFFAVDMADVPFGTINAGDTWSKVVIAYTANAAANNLTTMIPMTLHDINVVPDGSSITIQINANGYFQAS